MAQPAEWVTLRLPPLMARHWRKTAQPGQRMGYVTGDVLCCSGSNQLRVPLYARAVTDQLVMHPAQTLDSADGQEVRAAWTVNTAYDHHFRNHSHQTTSPSHDDLARGVGSGVRRYGSHEAARQARQAEDAAFARAVRSCLRNGVLRATDLAAQLELDMPVVLARLQKVAVPKDPRDRHRRYWCLRDCDEAQPLSKPPPASLDRRVGPPGVPHGSRTQDPPALP